MVPLPNPTCDITYSTFGSAIKIRLISNWCSIMESNETPSAASVVILNWSISSLGRKPFGMTMYGYALPTSRPAHAHIVASLCHRTLTLPRPTDGRLKWTLSHLHVPGHVFGHDDGVIHHETHRERQCHHRKIVEGIAA